MPVFERVFGSRRRIPASRLEGWSFLRMGVVVFAPVAVVVAGTFLPRSSPPPIGPGSDDGRSPAVAQEIVARILENQDTSAVYRILPHYSKLSGFERYHFWNLAESLEMYDLAGFAQAVLPGESYPMTREVLADFIEVAGR